MLRQKQTILFCLIFMVALFIINRLANYPREAQEIVPSKFEGFDYINGDSKAIIPNIVHYILLGTNSLNFVAFLSMTSVLKIQKPKKLLIHSDVENFTGYYWSLLLSLADLQNITMDIMPIKRPTHVFGQPLSSIYHATDVARIIILMNFGGIYLDTDTLVLKPLDQFLNYEMVLGWPEKESIGTQILIGHKDARFLKLWLDGYRNYQPRSWYYNAGKYPFELLSEKPELIHRVKTEFGVQTLIDKLYEADSWNGWKDFFSIHLLSRHHPDVSSLDETSVKSYKHPFGEIASWILYGNKPSLINDKEKYWKL